MNNDIRKLVDDNWDEIKELIAQKAEAEQEPKTIWDLEIEDEEYYYYIPTYGQVCQGVFNNTYDERARSRRNAFLTREEAEFELERRKIEAIMRKYARPFKHEEDNWYIECSHASKHIGIDALCEYDCGIIYFESEEIARDVIDEIGEDKLKKYWFGVK